MQWCANCFGYGCRSALCPRGELCEGQCLEKMGAEITFAGGVNSVLQANSASHSYNLTTGDYASRQPEVCGIRIPLMPFYRLIVY